MGGGEREVAVGVRGGGGGAAIDGSEELAGAGETGPTGPQTDHRGHWDDAGTMASPIERIVRAGMVSCGARHE
jgi:hypothetical protein